MDSVSAPYAPTPAPVGLVVDDDPSMRHILVRALQRMHIDAVGLASGEAALAWIERNGAPALITMDLALPAMCGLRVCEALRAMPRTRDVPIVVVTARNDMQDMAGALELGAAYLEKPFRLRELTDTVTQLLSPCPKESEVRALEVTPTTAPQLVHFWVRRTS